MVILNAGGLTTEIGGAWQCLAIPETQRMPHWSFDTLEISTISVKKRWFRMATQFPRSRSWSVYRFITWVAWIRMLQGYRVNEGFPSLSIFIPFLWAKLAFKDDQKNWPVYEAGRFKKRLEDHPISSVANHPAVMVHSPKAFPGRNFLRSLNASFGTQDPEPYRPKHT